MKKRQIRTIQGKTASSRNKLIAINEDIDSITDSHTDHKFVFTKDPKFVQNPLF